MSPIMDIQRRLRAVLLGCYAKCHWCGRQRPLRRSLTCALAQRRHHLARCPERTAEIEKWAAS